MSTAQESFFLRKMVKIKFFMKDLMRGFIIETFERSVINPILNGFYL